MKIMAKLILCILILSCMTLIAPFISFSNNDYLSICRDAARLFGIDSDEYTVEFIGNVVNASGENVNGTFNIDYNEKAKKIYKIKVKKSFSRPFVIGTIFHEFAHAAQEKFNMKLGDYSREQHAELLAFTTLWHGGYKWNAIHMIVIHSLHAKPSEYLAPKQIWNIALTGNSAIMV